MSKLDYKELFDCGYIDCSNCEHLQGKDDYCCDNDWYCGFNNIEYPTMLDDLENCPLGDNAPVEEMDEETLSEFIIKEETK